MKKANDVRAKRAQLKQDLKAGKGIGVKMLDNPPDWMETMKIIDFLMALPMIGRVRSLKYLKQCGVPPLKTIGGMSSRQRKDLRIALLRRT